MLYFGGNWFNCYYPSLAKRAKGPTDSLPFLFYIMESENLYDVRCISKNRINFGLMDQD